ncbi:YheC/YheD family protein [Neobacillus sp. CF12]|uniref:YheC/YheD family protein n=1 Tax=Neobacillus sp. CF12 TaxID=3055864 RepID=UPI0025A27E21|nr:YheC/YheD family protein [Neobacillus sp. CF12]MDM5327214.1 YheC/YheD family protein [Neobacillus sp. CF12]
MDNIILLSRHTSNSGILTLHPKLAESMGITQITARKIRFGAKTYQSIVDISDDLPLNGASLSGDILDMLNIPQHCSLEIKQNGNEIQMGPFIGLLAGYYQSSIKKYLDHLRDYVLLYHEIKGAILVFSLDHVDKTNQTVKGFLYNPLTKQWEEGIYPYPSSIFVMTSSVSSAWIQHFKSVIGDTVFNDFFHTRWSIHKKLSSSVGVKCYLPDTNLYGSPQDLYYFLKKFPNLIVKPLNSANRSTIRVFLKDSNSLVITNLRTLETKSFKFNNREQAYSIFKKYFKDGEYLIQESIDVTGYRTITIRIITVKDHSGQWKAMGLFTRGDQSEENEGKLMPLVKFQKEMVADFLQQSDLYASLTYQELIHITIDTVKEIESMGVHFANAAVDIIVGELGDIWISEIDHFNPSHEIALVAGYPELYYEILKTNMLYAKRLAGF